MTEKQYGIHDYRYQFRVITNDKEEISRIFFEEKVTGEIIEGRGNITRWINKLVDENEQLKKENKRLTDKLNETALEFLNHDMVTMGKATEISEMSYYDFLKFRKENGNPMELQE